MASKEILVGVQGKQRWGAARTHICTVAGHHGNPPQKQEIFIYIIYILWIYIIHIRTHVCHTPTHTHTHTLWTNIIFRFRK